MPPEIAFAEELELEEVLDEDAPPGNVCRPLAALLLRLARLELEAEKQAA